MSKRYDTKAAVKYMEENGVIYANGTLEVWRCERRGPAYVKINNRPYYTKETLDAFMEGRPVRTIDSVA